jgi:hypothetical protein
MAVILAVEVLDILLQSIRITEQTDEQQVTPFYRIHTVLYLLPIELTVLVFEGLYQKHPFCLSCSWVNKILVFLGPSQNSPRNYVKSLINNLLTLINMGPLRGPSSFKRDMFEDDFCESNDARVGRIGYRANSIVKTTKLDNIE